MLVTLRCERVKKTNLCKSAFSLGKPMAAFFIQNLLLRQFLLSKGLET